MTPEKLARRKCRIHKRERRIRRRLRVMQWPPQDDPMFSARNVQYEVADRTRAFSVGGIGLVHRLCRKVGLISAIDRRLALLKLHLPYHESDHVLNIAYNILAGGRCLDDLELLRHDEVYMDALGAARIPDPTTAGDFCRRFSAQDNETLMDVINEVRLRVWKNQPDAFFDEAIIEADGTVAGTTGECKQGMDVSYKGVWGYHPLVVSLANTGEPLFLVNRSGNRPSHEGAASRFDQAIELCERAGFRSITLRGDTDFSQTRYLDGWDARGVTFVFGYDAKKSLIEKAESLPASAWAKLKRAPKHEPGTKRRVRPANVKETIVEARGYKNLRLNGEHVASFAYQPTACRNVYRMVVVKKDIHVHEGQERLFDECRYFFYLTNDELSASAEIVFSANDRCNQENLIAQLGGVRALSMPSNTLNSNWAYMIMASLAWTLKAWLALMLPERGRWKEKHRAEKQRVLTMEFRSFLNAFMRVPAQLIKQGRRLVLRLLAWNRDQHIFLRLDEALGRPMLR